MLKASIPLVFLSLFLVGCDKIVAKGESELPDDMSRLAQAPAASQEFLKGHSLIECHAKIKNTCSSNGCEASTDVRITQTFAPHKQVYKRSDAQGGDEYPATVSQSGIWYNVGIPQGGIVFRFNTIGDFLEIVTLNDTAIVYSGSCKFQ